MPKNARPAAVDVSIDSFALTKATPACRLAAPVQVFEHLDVQAVERR